MVKVLVIAHAPLASALRQVAEHVYPDCAPMLSVLDVPPGMGPEDVETAARGLMAATPGREWLVLTDVPGATPSNGALRRRHSDPQRESPSAVTGAAMRWMPRSPLGAVLCLALLGAGVMAVSRASNGGNGRRISAAEARGASE